MLTIRRNDPAEWLRLALDGLDTQIAELREMRAKLAAMIDQPSADPGVKGATSRNRRKLSAAARAKISAAQKARRAKERKGKAEKQKPKGAAKTARAKANPIEPAPARMKAKKSIDNIAPLATVKWAISSRQPRDAGLGTGVS